MHVTLFWPSLFGQIRSAFDKDKVNVDFQKQIFQSFSGISKLLGPVVRSSISLTKSLVKNLFSLIVLTKSIVVIFFAKKLLGASKAPHTFFSTK